VGQVPQSLYGPFVRFIIFVFIAIKENRKKSDQNSERGQRSKYSCVRHIYPWQYKNRQISKDHLENIFKHAFLTEHTKYENILVDRLVVSNGTKG